MAVDSDKLNQFLGHFVMDLGAAAHAARPGLAARSVRWRPWIAGDVATYVELRTFGEVHGDEVSMKSWAGQAWGAIPFYRGG